MKFRLTRSAFRTALRVRCCLAAAHPPVRRSRTALRRAELGQTTAEYALVLLGAAAVALLLVAWATGSGKIDQLFDAVFDRLISKAR